MMNCIAKDTEVATNLLKAMKVRGNSIRINDYIVVRKKRNYFQVIEGAGYMDSLMHGTIEEVAARITR